MKKLTIVFTLFLIALPTVFAGNWSSDGNSYLINLASSDSTRDQDINYTTSDAFIDFELNMTHAGFNYYLLETADSGSLDGRWTAAGLCSSVTTYSHSGARGIKVDENGGACNFNPDFTDNFTVVLWALDFPDDTSPVAVRLEGVGSPVNDRLTVGYAGTDTSKWFLRNSAGSYQTSSISRAASSNEWKWIKLDPRGTGTGSYNCLVANNTFDCENTISVNDYTDSFFLFETDVGDIRYADDIIIFNQSQPYNTSKQTIESTRLVSSSTFNQVRFWYYGTSKGENAIQINFSCNNKTSWASITNNNTVVSCPNSQVSNDLHFRIIHNSTLTNGSYYNFTVSTLAIPDTTPPNITFYNMTSEGGEGCINWNTSKSNPCSTSDVSPTVSITTNENAWCATGTQDINFTRYDDLVINRSCVNEGTQSLICSLVSEDELVYDNSTIYISCRDASNNTNTNSTSGALKLSITGLEAAGRTSIGLGIQNALLNSYTNYTDLQIYARNLSNSQVRGTFDRAAKKGSKMWAFNRIGVSDSYVNMFNLTPVLYTLEFANITSARITNLTELMINVTK